MSGTALVSIALVHLIAAISPGPAFILSIRTAASEGFRPAAGLAVGFGIGAAIWGAAAILGQSVIFQTIPPLLVALKIAGGIFLLWLAVSLWRGAAKAPPAPGIAAPRTTLAAVRLGLAAQLANPKPAVFFGAVFVGLVPIAADGADKAIIIANVFWVETAWYVTTARIFSTSRARAIYGQAKIWIHRSMAGILAVLGARIATS